MEDKVEQSVYDCIRNKCDKVTNNILLHQKNLTDSWICTCGKENIGGNFCTQCGKKRGKQYKLHTNYYWGLFFQNKQRIVALGVLNLCLITLIGFISNNQSTKKESVTQPVKQQSSAPVKEKEQKVGTELSLGGVSLGDTSREVLDLLGKPQKKEKRESGIEQYYFQSMRVNFKNDKVVGIISENSSVKTKRGIHEGSSKSDVVKAYGKKYDEDKVDGHPYYEYVITDGNIKGIVRFSYTNQDKVDYISIRVYDRNEKNQSTSNEKGTVASNRSSVSNSSSTQNEEPSLKDAENVFLQYANACANGDYAQAYAYLTDDVQEKISYERFVKLNQKGPFKDKIKSVETWHSGNSAIMSFHDNQGEERSVIMYSGDGKWKISSIRNTYNIIY